MSTCPIAFADDVSEVLDLFYEPDGYEPDWSAIGLKIALLPDPRCALLEVLKIMHLVYEEGDFAAAITELYADTMP